MQAVLQGFFPDGANFLRHMTPSLWSHLESDCSTPVITLFGLRLTHPLLGLSAIGGVLIGFSHGLRLIRLSLLSLGQGNEEINQGKGKGKNREREQESRAALLFYGLSFLFFGCMNLSGIFYHCLQPPPIYLQSIPNSIPSNEGITYFAHVIDVCSTCCSCLSFIIGRFYSLRFVETNPFYFFFLFIGIYALGFVGLVPSSPDSYYATRIPFIGELLYPGAVNLVFLVVPLCNWSKRHYLTLFFSFISLVVAFLLAAGEKYLCLYMGPFGTATGWCFFFCDVTFLFLAQLIDNPQKKNENKSK